MVIATKNKGKIEEIKEILKGYDIKNLSDVNIDIDVKEDQDTFHGNASKKAHEVYNIIGEPVIADDSGLCIKSLGGWPGVLTHRFLGENTTFRQRNQAIIEKIKDKPINETRAKVVCNIVYFDGKNEISCEGVIEGHITKEPVGENGFGFDEIFMTQNGKTLAQLSKEEKNTISARYIALMKLKEKLNNLK